jgi:hypothetical protein
MISCSAQASNLGTVLNVTVIDNVILSAVLISKYSPAAIRA